MSTPVTSTPLGGSPRTTKFPSDDDLKARMQHMIDLQHVQQQQFSPYRFQNKVWGGKTTTTGPQQQQQEEATEVPPKTASAAATTGTATISARSSASSRKLSEMIVEGVGQGTLLFPSNKKFGSSRIVGGDDNNNNVTNAAATSSSKPLLSPSSPTQQQQQQQHQQHQKQQQHSPIHSHYGATKNTAAVSPSHWSPTPQIMQAPSTTPIHNNNNNHQQQQHLHQQHDFHYGNPDYHDPFNPTTTSSNNSGNYDNDDNNHGDNDDNGYYDKRNTSNEYYYFEPSPAPPTPQRIKNNHHHGFGRFLIQICCVLTEPLWNSLCCCCRENNNDDNHNQRQQQLHQQRQQLYRSFCYGAIDGMLTGSGIIAAFSGMSLLSVSSPLAVRAFCVAFCGAACFADSVCMALGHVWTTYVLVSAHSNERSMQRKAIEENRANAKGQLVDMLLERGMLKIDAMSLADTLEGYPDLFVSALVGDALVGGGGGGTATSTTSVNGGGGSARDGSNSSGASLAGWFFQQPQPQYNTIRDDNTNNTPSDNTTETATGGGVGISYSSIWKFPSFGTIGYNNNDNNMMHDGLMEDHDDMEYQHHYVHTAMQDSQKEGIFMMLGFSVFAVVPGFIQLVLPLIVVLDNDVGGENNAVVSEFTIVVTITSIIIWFLGVWKSQFLDSEYWVLFGIETVVVLLVCMVSAYSVGAMLCHFFPQITQAYNNAI